MVNPPNIFNEKISCLAIQFYSSFIAFFNKIQLIQPIVIEIFHPILYFYAYPLGIYCKIKTSTKNKDYLISYNNNNLICQNKLIKSFYIFSHFFFHFVILMTIKKNILK